MKMTKWILLGLCSLVFFGCANRYSSPILIERGEGRKEYEREYFAIKESMGIDKRLRDVFKQGYIEEGMTTTWSIYYGVLPIEKQMMGAFGSIILVKAS